MTDQEPAVTVGAVGATVGAVLAALRAFGVDLDGAQHDALLQLWAAVGPLAVALVTRRLVWSPASHRHDVARARADAWETAGLAQAAEAARRSVRPDDRE